MAGTGLKAIETVYNGYRFRSRLEARWAVFYDHMGIEYQYEPQGFDLGGIWYLPDFYLPQHECWIEVKPQRPSADEGERAARLAVASEQFVYIFWGEIPYPAPDVRTSESAEVYGPVFAADGVAEQAWGDQDHWWTACIACGRVGIHYQGDEDRLGAGCAHIGGPATERLLAAYAAARQARFEHGATPGRRPILPRQPDMSPVQSILAYCQHFPDRWHTHAELRGCLDRDDAILSGPAISTLLQRGQLRHSVATDGRIIYGLAPGHTPPNLG